MSVINPETIPSSAVEQNIHRHHQSVTVTVPTRCSAISVLGLWRLTSCRIDTIEQNRIKADGDRDGNRIANF
jgi:hypothetical protein